MLVTVLLDSGQMKQRKEKGNARTYTSSGVLCKMEHNSESFLTYPFDNKNPHPYYNLGMTLPNAPFPYPFIPNMPCKTEPVSVPEIEFSTDKSLPPSKLQVEKQNDPKSFLGPSSDIDVPPQETTDSSSTENIDVVNIMPNQTTSSKCSNTDYVAKFDLAFQNEVFLKKASVTSDSISQAKTYRPSSV